LRVFLPHAQEAIERTATDFRLFDTNPLTLPAT
jgi:hypothetical protein